MMIVPLIRSLLNSSNLLCRYLSTARNQIMIALIHPNNVHKNLRLQSLLAVCCLPIHSAVHWFHMEQFVRNVRPSFTNKFVV